MKHKVEVKLLYGSDFYAFGLVRRASETG